MLSAVLQVQERGRGRGEAGEGRRRGRARGGKGEGGGVEGGGKMEKVRENKGVRERMMHGLHCTLFTAPKDTLSALLWPVHLPPPHLLLAPIHHDVNNIKKEL